MNMEKPVRRAMQDWLRLRPYLYHFAPLENIRQIMDRGEMLSARRIVEMAVTYQPDQVDDPDTLLATPRRSKVSLRVGPRESDVFTLNDQRPMTLGNCFANLDCSPEEFVRTLNSYVFFWPGDTDGPRTKGKHGASFVSRYHHFAALRFRFTDIEHGAVTLKFCGCNSGAPQERHRIRRSPAIFRPFAEPKLVGQAVEVVAEGSLQLPDVLEYRSAAQPDWILVDRTAKQLRDIKPAVAPEGIPS